MADYKLLYEELSRNISTAVNLLKQIDLQKLTEAAELLEDTLYSAEFTENKAQGSNNKCSDINSSIKKDASE